MSPVPEDTSAANAISALSATIASTNSTVAVIANDIGHMKDDQKELGADVKTALGRLADYSADLNATPAGREVLRTFKEHDVIHVEHETRLGLLEGFQKDIRASLRTLKAIGALIATIAAGGTVLVTLHAFGVF